MGVLLVSDTSVLVDLQRAGMLSAAFNLPTQFAVPELLYERELKRWRELESGLGRLIVLVLPDDGVRLAQEYRLHEPRLSLPDAFALALAKTAGYVLLAGDANLRSEAERESVKCHGVLWVFDALLECHVVEPAELAASLQRLATHPRCRLPKTEVRDRVERYRGLGKSG